MRQRDVPFGPYIEKEMNSLEKAGKWDNLEAWLAIAWRSQLSPESLEHVSRVTDELLKKRRWPALWKFRELLYQLMISRMAQGEQLKRICDKVQLAILPESPPLTTYVPICPTQRLLY